MKYNSLAIEKEGFDFKVLVTSLTISQKVLLGCMILIFVQVGH